MRRAPTFKPLRSIGRWQTLFFTSLIALITLGILFMLDISLVESAATFGDPYVLLRQHLIGLGLGLVMFLIGLATPVKLWLRLGPALYIISIGLLVLVFVPGVGLELNGAHRWIAIGSLRFQPVEFFKIALIFYFSSWLTRSRNILHFLSVLTIPAILILLQPDLGSLIIVICIALLLFYLGGGKIKHLFSLGALGIPILIIMIIISPYRFRRLTTFLNPESDPLGASFHIRQISLALGRGGLLGQGLGNSHQKFAYIPESTTDSIFAIIAEEIGFVGSLFIFSLFALLWYAGYRTIQQAQITDSLRLLALGLLSWIVLQTLLNLAAVVGLVPLTGVPLPFFSYGRSAQVMTLLACAIIIKLGRRHT